jgi:predicted esterase
MIKPARKISSSRPQLHRANEVRPEALVAFINDASERNAAAVSTTDLRNQVAPLADWIEIDLGPVSPSRRTQWLTNELSNALRRRQMRPSQLVLLSWHNAAHTALGLILRGALPCAGIVAVDIPCTLPPAPLSISAASIRIVLHGRQHDPADARLIDALRRQDADVRFMTLPSGSSEAGEITARAAATFLSELTARACRQSTENTGRSHV